MGKNLLITSQTSIGSLSELEEATIVKRSRVSIRLGNFSDNKSEEYDKPASEKGDSIMEWFKNKGIQSGNPSLIVESFHEKNLKTALNMQEKKISGPSLLLSRRLKTKLTLG